jgi:hypothetical protein
VPNQNRWFPTSDLLDRFCRGIAYPTIGNHFLLHICGKARGIVAGLNAVKATNAIAPGINNVQARLKVAGDGRPRLYVYEFALQERDAAREAAHKPFCLEQEIDGYSWPASKDGAPVKEVPIKINDHAMDALRYMCQFLAEPKRGGGVLVATLDEEEEKQMRAGETTNNDLLFTGDLRDFSSLFHDEDIGW